MNRNTKSFVAAVLAGGMLVGCGGPEELGTEEQMPAPVAEQAPAPVAEQAPAVDSDRPVSAMSFWAWQCGAQTASLRDYQYGPAVAQIYSGWDVRVDSTDGGWWWVYSPNYNRSGWVLASYFCRG